MPKKEKIERYYGKIRADISRKSGDVVLHCGFDYGDCGLMFRLTKKSALKLAKELEYMAHLFTTPFTDEDHSVWVPAHQEPYPKEK